MWNLIEKHAKVFPKKKNNKFTNNNVVSRLIVVSQSAHKNCVNFVFCCVYFVNSLRCDQDLKFIIVGWNLHIFMTLIAFLVSFHVWWMSLTFIFQFQVFKIYKKKIQIDWWFFNNKNDDDQMKDDQNSNNIITRFKKFFATFL